jgi:hypothetical protein
VRQTEDLGGADLHHKHKAEDKSPVLFVLQHTCLM